MGVWGEGRYDAAWFPCPLLAVSLAFTCGRLVDEVFVVPAGATPRGRGIHGACGAAIAHDRQRWHGRCGCALSTLLLLLQSSFLLLPLPLLLLLLLFLLWCCWFKR